jgi:hypothetical protein
VIRSQAKNIKVPIALTYAKKLFDFDISDITSLCDQQKNNPDFDEKMKKGFEKFRECLDEYLELLDDISSVKDSRIKIFSSITLKNGAILRATNEFHKRPWFSNIAIAMDNEELFEYQSDSGICYAQALLIAEMTLPNKSSLHLALVQWYDFKSQKTPFVYGCPLLKLIELYHIIDVEAIEDIVHIVPRFNKTNEYFVNKYLF